MNKAKKSRKTFGIHLIAIAIVAIAVTSQAGPVVVTPGSSAGYLYFPPAAVASGSGSGGESFHPVLGDCEKLDTIGGTCRWGDGTVLKLGAKSGITKYVYQKVETALTYGCNGQFLNTTGTGVDNTNALTCSAVASYCKSKGAGYFLPSISELSLINTNRAVLGLSGNLVSSTLESGGPDPWGEYYYNVKGFLNSNQYSFDRKSSSPQQPFICLRSY